MSLQIKQTTQITYEDDASRPPVFYLEIKKSFRILSL